MVFDEIIVNKKKDFDYFVRVYGQIYIKGEWRDLIDISPKIKYEVDTESELLTTESGVEYFFRTPNKKIKLELQ